MNDTKKMPSKYTRKILTLLLVIFGNVLYALVVKLFLIPAGLVTGGTTGIALAIQHYTNLPISGFVLGFNVLMLVLGFFVLGKQFAFTTIVSTFVYPIALEGFNQLLGDVVLTNDIWLCTAFSGLGIGAALGIVIRAGASTGGMDIPPLVLNHFFRIPVSVSLYVFDFLILLLQAVYNPPEKLLYGIVLVLIYTIVLDKLMLMGTTKTEVRIVSKYHEEIRKAILSQIDRGVTLLSATGGYLGAPTELIFSVISNRELPRLEQLVHDIDPDSFMVVNRVSEVRGRGFSMGKKYQ
ncbi:MAG: YitT family protein [Lachnospiraceae bacterium]|nr:YitT family protein [Cuneatibacter sp.]MDD6455748.1 YitT family protein [Lachnospiraceae bacterium]